MACGVAFGWSAWQTPGLQAREQAGGPHCYFLCTWLQVDSVVSTPCVCCADTVICMDEYLPADVTTQAQAISRRHAGPGDSLPRAERYGDVTPRTLASGKLAWVLVAAAGPRKLLPPLLLPPLPLPLLLRRRHAPLCKVITTLQHPFPLALSTCTLCSALSAVGGTWAGPAGQDAHSVLHPAGPGRA